MKCLALVFLCIFSVFSLISCGGGGGGATVVTLPDIAAVYANAVNWNTYVKNDGTGDAADGTETGRYYAALIHGGETLYTTLAGQTSCTGFTAIDALGVFDWECQEPVGQDIIIVSTGLKNGMVLSDLINWTTLAWHPNSLTVRKNTATYGRTADSIWWSNSLVEDDTVNPITPVAGDIVLITANPQTGYTAGVDNVSYVAKPGITLTTTGGTGTVNIVSRQYIWFEGAIDATNATLGVRAFANHFLTLRGLTVANATSEGIAVAGLGQYSHGIRVEEAVVHNCGSSGLSLTDANVDVKNIELYNNTLGQGDLAIIAANVATVEATAENVYVHDSPGYGLWLSGITDGIFNNIRVDTITGTGIFSQSSANNSFSNLQIANCGNGGIQLNSGDNNSVTNANVANCQGNGLTIQTDNNQFTHLNFYNNSGSGIHISGGSGNSFLYTATTNNTGNGIRLANGTSNDNSFFSVLTASNDLNGIADYDGNTGTLFSRVVAVNNGQYGIDLSNSTSSSWIDILATNSNGNYNVFLGGTSTTIFSGKLIVGNSATTNDCIVSATSSGLVNGTCANAGGSDATLTTAATIAGELVGKVEDVANPSDSAAATLYDNITDWYTFDNSFRTWGLDGSTFPNADQQGICSTGQNCRIWDWTPSGPASLIRDVLAMPTGNDAFTHTGSAGTVTFLRHAAEIPGLGNGNGMCEAGESCLYQPHIGAYQGGEGFSNLTGLGVTTGTVAGVNLFSY